MSGAREMSLEEIAWAKAILSRFEHSPEPPALTDAERNLLSRNGARLTAEFEQAGVLDAIPKVIRDLFVPRAKA